MFDHVIIWTQSPFLYSLENIKIRWYSVLFASTFLFGRYLGIYMHKKEGRPTNQIDSIIAYMMVGTTLGARLGHVFFYDWAYYSHHWMEILLPFKFSPSFHFTGFSGLASHGAMIGILISIFLYTSCDFVLKLKPFSFKAKLKPKDQRNFLWLMDKIAIAVAFCGMMIRIGNFFNSEIYGEPNNSGRGIVFLSDFCNNKLKNKKFIESCSINKIPNSKPIGCLQPIAIKINFKRNIKDQNVIYDYINYKLKQDLIEEKNERCNIYEKAGPVSYRIEKTPQKIIAEIYTSGVIRHPSQLYEAFSCLIVFIILFSIWYKKKGKIREGFFLGSFLIIIFGLRFFYEIIKPGKIILHLKYFYLTTPQILSIFSMVLGIIIFFWNWKNKKNNTHILHEDISEH